jgi:putative ABC transport system permease protein
LSVLWVKFWADLLRGSGRTVLAIVSIAAGVMAVGAIFGMVDMLLSGMDRAHRSVDPSHTNIILRQPVPLEVIEDLESIEGITQIDPANLLTVRYRLSADEEWRMGTLVHRPDYDQQVYDRIERVQGEWPGGGRLGIERLSGAYLGLGIDDRVTIEIDGQAQDFEINGLLRHPFVQPPLFGGQANFFIDSAGLEEQFGIPQGFYSQLFVRVDTYSRENAMNAAGSIRQRLGEQGYGVAVSLYQEPDRHWGRMFVEGVNLVLRIMAVVSLLMSVVLVLNIFTALITQQTNQIGVIKAIGGRRGTIFRHYLAGAAAYGLLSLLIAVPLGALLAHGMSSWFLNLFNIDTPTFQYSPRAVLLQVLAGFFAPLLAALAPVAQGAWITVREAIASYGLGGDFGASRVDRLVERAGRLLLPTLYAAALGNIFRRKVRLSLTVLVLTAAGVMFLVIMSLVSSTNYTLDNEMARQRYDVRIGFIRPQRSKRCKNWPPGLMACRRRSCGTAAMRPSCARASGWKTRPAWGRSCSACRPILRCTAR